MVFVQPSIADQLGPGLNQFIAGVNHAINPDYQFQEAMKVQLATNPKLAQSLTDLETQAPGTLAKLGFGPLTNILKAIPESAQGQVNRESKGDIVASEKSKIAMEGAQAKLEGSKFSAALSAIEDPVMRHEFINRFLTGSISPQDEIAQMKAQTEEQKARASLISAQLPGELAKAKLQEKNLTDVLNKYPALRDADPVAMIRKAAAGQPVPEMASYAQLPGGAEALSNARIIVEAQMNRDNQYWLKMQFNHQVSLEEKANVNAAASMLKLTKAGTLQAWRTVLEDPAKVEEIQKKPFNTLNQNEKDILHAAQAQDQQQQRIDTNEMIKESVSGRQAHAAAAIAIAKDESPAGVNTALAPLNLWLGNQAKQSGQLYQARYGQLPDVGQKETKDRAGYFHMPGHGNGLYYVDQNGIRVDDNAPFVNKTMQLNQAAGNFLTQYNSDPNPQHKKVQLDRLQKERPDLYDLIKDRIKP